MQDTTETRACPRCAHENTVDTNFCANCGLRLDGMCPNCGTQNEHSTHYCVNCGHDLTSEVVQRQASSRGDLRDVHGVLPAGPFGAPEPRGIDCPRCHGTNEPGAAFCYNCGLPFDSAVGVEPRNVRGIPAFVGAKPGGFWLRLLALILDNLVITGIYFVVAPITIGETLGDMFRSMIDTGYQSTPSLILDFILTTVYGTLLVTYWWTTVGKKVFSMRVMRTDGSKVGFARAALRELVRYISVFFFPLAIASAFMIGIRSDKRGLHDLMADTVVVAR